MSSKIERIKSYLASGRSLTPAEAIVNGFGFRLAARILDLRRAGLPVITELKTNPESGDKYASYRLPRVGDRIRCTPQKIGPVTGKLYYSRGDTGTILWVCNDDIYVRFDTARRGYHEWYVQNGDFELLQ